MTGIELQEVTKKLNKVYSKKTGDRLIFREVQDKWYLCNIVPLGEVTLISGTFEECMTYAKNLL